MKPSRRRLATSIALAIAIVSVLSVRLSYPELHPDEITYMSVVLESMVQDTVLPVQGNGALFINKPPLALWLMRSSFEILGPSPFAARLPSVLAAAATAVVIYLFGAAVFGEGVGILAALIFAFTPGLLEMHGIRSATPDALEILLVTSAIVSLELWRRCRRPWMLWCLLIFVAASAWVKSPFALAVFLAYLLGTELPARRTGQGTPRFGGTVALIVAIWLSAYLVWLGTLSAATSPRAVVKRLFVQQYVQRIEGKIGDLHGPGYYLANTIQDFGPLLLLPVGAVAIGLLSRRFSLHDLACLAVWSLTAPVLATASASKLPWYAYLSYPGIALLVAASAYRLSSRRAVQSALLAACLLVLVWRMPAERVWPAEAQYRGLTGRLWEIASRDPRIEVVPGPGFRLPRQRDHAYREARLFLRMLSWRQSKGSPGPCRALLVNHLRDVPAGGDVLELYRPLRPTRRGAGLFLVDDCDGRLREQVLGSPGSFTSPAAAGEAARRRPAIR